MAYLKLQHVFAGLMTLSGVTAFIVPSRFLQARVPVVDALFAPISTPSGAIARWAHSSFAAPELSKDTRSGEVVKRENETLKDEVASLQVRLNALAEKNAERDQIGPIRDWCTPFKVVGTDAGTRLSLGVGGSSLQGLREGMVALYPGGIVGRVERAGLAGARVQLVTDVNFHVRVGFVRFDGAKFVALKPDQAVAEGTGRGAMKIINLTRDMVTANGLKPTDWVTLNEPDWPTYLQGRALGRIASIGPRPDAPVTFAQIIVEPAKNLLRLNEVLIVTRESGKAER